MRIIIVGDGKVGAELTEQLSREDHDIVVIDRNPKVIENAVNTFDVMGICGNGAGYDILMEAGADKADLLIAATSADEVNILSCLTARRLGTQNTIARARHPEYVKQLVMMREELGLSMMVNPEREAAREILRLLRFPGTIRIDDFSEGRAELVELRIQPGTPLCGMPLSALYAAYKVKVLICAVQRGEQVFIPDGGFVLQGEDRIHITGIPGQLDAFLRLAGLAGERVREVLVVGGGKITYYLAQQMEHMGAGLKVIEQEQARCLELAGQFPRAVVIRGDGSDQELLLEEGIEQADACVTLTDIDEQNILISMFAASRKVGKVITKVSRDSLAGMLGSIGLESIISPKNTAANRIIRYVRGMRNAADSSHVETLHRLVNNRVEALEFRVKEPMRLTGIPLKDLPIRQDVLIGGILRQQEMLIPGGNDTIEPGDGVIVVTLDRRLRKLSDILA